MALRSSLVCLVVAFGCRPAPVESPAVTPPPAGGPPRAEAQAPPPQLTPCRVDFDEVRRLVEGSYAGYPDKLARIGAERLGAVTTEVGEAASRLDGEAKDPRCAEVLRRYVDTFHDGHLAVIESNRATSKEAATDQARPSPRFDKVSARIVVLTLPSFGDPTAVTQLVERHRLEIRRSEHFIVDVRGNSGGSDAAYTPLMKYVYSGPYEVVGTEVLATDDNAAAWRRILPQIPQELTSTRRQINDAIDRMLRARAGAWVELAPDRTVTMDEILPLPRRVSVFFDDRCASSCEQFLLAARQSRKVTTYGQTSAGVLDYANVRFVQLPSKTRALAWATTRSRRLPDDPVDGVGIAPDVRVTATALAALDADGMAKLVVRCSIDEGVNARCGGSS